MADPTIAALGAGLWQDTGTTVTSASVSPVSGSVVLAVAVITENGTLSGFDISNSLTLTQTDLGGGVLDTTGGFRTQCRIKSIPITSGAAMTVTAAATGGSHVQLFLFQITNQGVTPFGVSVSAQMSAAYDGAKSITLPSAPPVDGVVFSLIFSTTSSGGMSVTPGSDQTEIADSAYEDWNAIQIQTRSGSVNTSTSIAWVDIAVGDAWANAPIGFAIVINGISGGGGATSFIFRRPMATLSSHFR